MSQSLQPIIQIYRKELQRVKDQPEQSNPVRGVLMSLMLAEAIERKAKLNESHPQHPPQLAVIGPTQVGKSTVVNLLLGISGTKASSMAGFTMHSQGFSCSPFDDSWQQQYFSELVKREQGELSRESINEYACTDVSHKLTTSVTELFGEAIVWDTADFDSVASFSYLNPVLQTVALADVVLMVVSREKYADKSVWDMLSALCELGKPVVIVMNKVAPQIRGELAASVDKKCNVVSNKTGCVLLPPVLFIDQVDATEVLTDSAELTELRGVLAEEIRKINRTETSAGLRTFVDRHWAEWTSPVVAVHAKQQRWRSMVDDTCDKLIARYESEYLQNSRHKETFQLAVAELLVLLEVPGVAEPLTRIRNLVTWPVRKIIKTATEVQNPSSDSKDTRSEERRLLESLLEHGLTGLSVQASNHLSSEKTDDDWWQQLQTQLRSQSATLAEGYRRELDNYEILLKVETERAAQALYVKLQEQPAMLNSLRVARVSADAAAVVLAVKSGGLGAADLVIAPAMLSLTSMLTEGALGKYMDKVQQDLKAYQRKAVNSAIKRKLGIKLKTLGSDSARHVPPQQLAELAAYYQVSQSEVANDSSQ